MKTPARFVRVPAFVRDVSLTAGTQAAQALFSMVGGVLVARALGPSGRGAISVIVALGSMAVLIASLGVHYSSVYFLGRWRSRRDAIISNNYVFGLVGGVMTASASLVVVFFFSRGLLNKVPFAWFAFYLPFIACNYFNGFARGTALGEGRVKAYNLPDLLSGAALLFGTGIILLIFGAHVVPLLAVRIGTEGVIALFLVVYIRRVIGFRFHPSLPLLRQQTRYGLKNYAASLLWTVLLGSDLLLCNHFLGSDQAGIYSVAVSFSLPVTLIANVCGILVFQRVSAESDRARRVTNMNRLMRLLAVIVGGVALVMALTIDSVVPLVYGVAYTAAAGAFLLLLPGLFALSLETVLANYLAGEGSPPIVYLAPMAGVILNVGANLFVIPRWGINGAAVTSSVGYVVVFMLVLAYYLRSTSSSFRDMLLASRNDWHALWRAGPTSSLAPVGSISGAPPTLSVGEATAEEFSAPTAARSR